jgi:hypothetical protein
MGLLLPPPLGEGWGGRRMRGNGPVPRLLAPIPAFPRAGEGGLYFTLAMASRVFWPNFFAYSL